MHIRPSSAEMRARAEIEEAADHHAGSWIPLTLSVPAVLVIPAATYLVVVNDWASALTGQVYTESEHRAELDAAREARLAAGRSHGFETGFSAGEASGFAAGREAGELVGYDSGYLAGEVSGSTEGFETGHTVGYSVGVGAGYEQGQTEGHEEGLVAGYAHGFVAGCLALFEASETDRVGSWWDYHYSPAYAYHYEPPACASSLYWPLTLDSDG